MINAHRISGQPKKFLIKIDKFNGGTATLINPARLPTRFAVESENLIQDQDGIWRTRPGTDYYGNAISGISSFDGATEYVKNDGTREIIAIGGGSVYKSGDDGDSWTLVSGATFTSGYKITFLQINNLLYISNGYDYLAVYDGSSLSTYSSLSTPSGLSGTRGSGLSSGSYNNYYRVVAVNSIGVTLPSASVNVTTDKDRDYWSETPSDNEKITLSWTAVSGATGYQIYWGRHDQEETLIGLSSTNSFVDEGEQISPHNPYIETPNDNTTAAPKFKSMDLSGNIIWATNDPNNEYRVYWSGGGQYLGSFSPFYGGGWVDCEPGGKNKTKSVVHYRTGKGEPIATVLASSGDGKGVTFQIQLTSVSVGDTSITVPVVYKLVGSIGTDAPYATTKVADNVFFLNKRGIYALRNKEQMFNVLSTDNLIQPIRDKFESINQSKIGEAVGYYRYPRVYFSLANGSENDITIFFDTERRNWSWKWTIGFSGFFEHTDTNGRTHFLAIPTSGNRLVEISDNFTGDFGQPFYQSYISPLVPIDKDLTTMAKIRNAIYELGHFSGSVKLEIIGIKADKEVSTLATKTVSSTIGTSGIGADLFSDFLFSDTNGTPTTFTYSTIKKKLNVGKKIYGIQFKVYTTNEAYFELLSIQAKGFLIHKRPPSQWN